MITIYTAIFGDYDILKDPLFINKDIKFICFTDQDFQSNIWEIRKVEKEESDPRREARKYKILSHKYIDTEISLWIDGGYQLIKNPLPHIEKMLSITDMACSIHPLRKCIYDEAERCLMVNKGDPEKIRNQMFKYSQEKYPVNNDLIHSSVLLRRITPEVIKVEEDWWNEVKNFSVRDQLSFNYIVWKNNFKYKLWSWRTFINSNFHKGEVPITPPQQRRITPPRQRRRKKPTIREREEIIVRKRRQEVQQRSKERDEKRKKRDDFLKKQREMKRKR